MNKKKVAAALKYTQGETAPRLTAYGEGWVADRIIELATGAGVPLYREEGLAGHLQQVEIGGEIPPELYEIVAEILVFVYYLNQKEGEIKDDFREGDR